MRYFLGRLSKHVIHKSICCFRSNGSIHRRSSAPWNRRFDRGGGCVYMCRAVGECSTHDVLQKMTDYVFCYWQAQSIRVYDVDAYKHLHLRRTTSTPKICHRLQATYMHNRLVFAYRQISEAIKTMTRSPLYFSRIHLSRESLKRHCPRQSSKALRVLM